MNDTLALITTGVNLIMIFGGFIYFARKGTPSAAQDVIDIFKTRDTEQKTLIETLREEVKDNGLALAKLEGQMIEKDKKLEDFVKIFQGRDPGQEAFIKYITDAATNGAKYMADTGVVLSEIRTFMETLNQSFSQSQQKDKIVLDNFKTTMGGGKTT